MTQNEDAMDADDWPFDAPPDEAVLTTRDVLEERAPILRVTHDAEDGGWQFLTGATVSTDEGRVVGLGEMVRRDETLRQVADLPEGWVAWRERPGAVWQREVKSRRGLLKDNRYDSEGTRRGEPEARYALAGAAIGLLLIYLGTRIRSVILRWPITAVGIVFLVVMTAYTFGLAWKNIKLRVGPVVDRARGHLREDPQLGTLSRDVKTRHWIAAVTISGRRVELAIGGDDEPDPALLERARALTADLNGFEVRLRDYLEREAAEWAIENPDLAIEVRQLHISAIVLRSEDDPGRIVLEFHGPNEMRYWACEYVDREMRNLNYYT